MEVGRENYYEILGVKGLKDQLQLFYLQMLVS